MGVGVAWVVVFTPLPNLLSRAVTTSDRLEPADAIVVLGTSVQPDGVLTDSSLRRALHGIVLYRKGLAPLLVFLGMARPHGPNEAEIRAELARTLAVPPQRILTVAGTRTTRGETARVAALLRPRGIRRILLVTDSQHLVRARPLFQGAGFEVVGAPADGLSSDLVNPAARLELMRRFVREMLARLYYRLAGYL